MNELFLKLLAMSLDAGWLALAVMLLRFLLSKAPRRLFPALWSFDARLELPKAIAKGDDVCALRYIKSNK